MSFKQFICENYIVGPALINKNGDLLVKGAIGDSHMDIATRLRNQLKIQNANWDKMEELLDAMEFDNQHVFIDSHGKLLNRVDAAKVAVAAGQTDPKTTVLQSHQLKNVKI